MRVLCDTRNIVKWFNPEFGLKRIKSGGFENALLDVTALCPLKEYDEIKKNNFKKEDGKIYLSESPNELVNEVKKRFTDPGKAAGVKLPVAMAPFADYDVKPTAELNSLLLELSKETLKAAVDAGCESMIVPPLLGTETYGSGTTGQAKTDDKYLSSPLWQTNSAFYRELADTASFLGSNIKILLTNRCLNIHGHLIRGVCSDPYEAAAWVDELNKVGSERFGFCCDVGIYTLCGQNPYEAMSHMGERIKAVIIRDCDGQNDVSMLPFSACEKGLETDYLSIIRGLRKSSFDGDIIIDLSETYNSFPDVLRPKLISLARDIGEYLKWQIDMENMIRRYDKRVLFGAGNMCRAYMKSYGEKFPPLFTCDNNSKRWGEEFCGLSVKSPDELKNISEDTAIFICNIYYDAVEEQLRSMGLKNPIERFNDEFMPDFHTDRLTMASL
ncbi:MAG: sugar phosphate isomerase/epimerase [Butyrivibrio sp.]|nr:sugar phosphate isomerase/epimerase [Butyrivibrio sp.]